MSKIVLIGAGSAMFGLGALGDIFKCKNLEGGTIVLFDINPQALKPVKDVANQFVSENNLSYTIVATTSRQEALQDADFCIISIEVGNRYELWEQDWHIPLQFGIEQVYGENGGPGGIFHSLRIIPPIMEICNDINKICPESYVINLSNPMTTISMAIHKKYPDLRLVGLCHEIASLIEHLPKILQTPFSNLSIKAGGLNHFSVLLEATYKDSGLDAYPEILEKAPAYFENTPERDLFMYILKYFNCLPITTDSHFSEYIQWAQEVADHKGVLDFYTNYKKECLLNQIDPYKRIQEGTAPSEYWRVVPVIEGVLTDSGHEELAVNIPNNGYLTSLPEDIVVEVPAIVDKKGIHGIPLDTMPQGFSGLLTNRIGSLYLTVDAALTGSKKLVMQALLVDPTNTSLKSTEKLLETMLEYQEPYLGYLK